MPEPNRPSRIASSPTTGDSTEVFVRILRGIVVDVLRDAVRELHDELRTNLLVELESRRSAPTTADDLLSVDDVARRLNMRPATVREWIKTGFLAAVPLGPAGRRYGIRPADLERALEQRGAKAKPMDMDAAAIQIVKSARVRTRGPKKE